MPRLASTSAVWLLFFCAGQALAEIDLVLQPEPQTITVGAQVEIGLFAVSDDGTAQAFCALDVILTWDPASLELREAVDDGPHNWSFVFGFLSDESLDGLNADCGEDVFCDPYTGLPFNDGNALFQAASFSEATATVEGLRVATFRFMALDETPTTDVVIEESRGVFWTTKVLQPGGTDVTGTLGSTTVTIKGMTVPTLSEWGVAVMTIVLLAAGIIVIVTRRIAA